MKALHRRAVLRGMLGGTALGLSLPVLEAMLNANGTAYADGTPLPRRLGIFFWGNGVRHSAWNPAQTGAGFALSPSLAGLASVREYVSVVSGMHIRTGNERGHHAGCVGILSGAPMIPQDPGNAGYASTFSRPSIDQVAAAHFTASPETRTAFRSLELGVSRRVIYGEGTTLGYLSHNGPDNVNKPIYSTAELYRRVFPSDYMPAQQQSAPDPRLALRRRLIDAVKDDARRLQQRVGRRDAERVEQHLVSLDALQQQIRTLEEQRALIGACARPDDPGAIGELEGQEQLTLLTNAMAETLRLALACDRTRVFSIMFSGSVGYHSFPELGIANGSHDLTHDEAGDQPNVQRGVAFTMQKLATFLEALKNTPEGDGNLLDNSAILASSDLSDGRDHAIDDYPILVCGKAGGALRGGVHYRSATAENTSKVLLTLLRAVGLPLTEFGVGGGRVDQGVPAIEA